MAKPETKKDNVPIEAGRYFTTFRAGFGSDPDYIEVREGDSGVMEYRCEGAGSVLGWQNFDDFWGLEDWGFSDRIEESKK